MLVDPSVTEMWFSTEQYDGEPAALVETVDAEASTFPASWVDTDDAGGAAVRCSAPQPRCDGGAAVAIDRYRLDAAFHAIGHRSSPVFRCRVADAYDRAGELVAR
jgi:hypothetical protein